MPKKNNPDIKWPVNPGLKAVKSKVNTYHSKYGKLVKGEKYDIDPADFGTEIFDPVGWQPGENRSGDPGPVGSPPETGKTNNSDNNVRRIK